MADEELNRHQRAAETKRRRTREAIISGALDLYGELERGDFTRDEIAEASGVGTATLHKNFGSKYEVLRLAYERLLSPLVDPIVKGREQGIYNPPDAVDELIRYIYTVARVSQKRRALTVSMIRSYFEAELTFETLGSPIAPAIECILQFNPFYLQVDDGLRYARTLLLDLQHERRDNVAMCVSRTLCQQVVRVNADGFNWSASDAWYERLERIEAAVDTSGIVDECGK
ncbi:TetR/AcrR family transcriptional regulator [Streptomyces sp. NBC_00988]|uniref:TetR/AcrR family transcriptional regulator n=1 Tax=Streptomyces sp. NBC_00988 TaxID=2903704 RepID=UPI003867E08B|nr:TetR/AcrR family transcriptional regulator [Streptomyces sp. NBC_00988]